MVIPNLLSYTRLFRTRKDLFDDGKAARRKRRTHHSPGAFGGGEDELIRSTLYLPTVSMRRRWRRHFSTGTESDPPQWGSDSFPGGPRCLRCAARAEIPQASDCRRV